MEWHAQRQELIRQIPDQMKSGLHNSQAVVLGVYGTAGLTEDTQFSLIMTYQNQLVRTQRGSSLEVSLTEPLRIGPRKSSTFGENSKRSRHYMGGFPEALFQAPGHNNHKKNFKNQRILVACVNSPLFFFLFANLMRLFHTHTQKEPSIKIKFQTKIINQQPVA